MTLLTTYPATRINDRFVKEGTNPFISFDPILVNYKDTIVKGKPNIDFRYQADFYSKIGVDIVTETVFNYPYPFITEKTYRAFASMRPFIIVGAYHTLNLIESVGFKTFSAIINEEYDNIKDPELRFIEVCNTIREFVSRPIDTIKQDLSKIADVLEHNQNHLSNLVNVELKKFKHQI